MFIRYLSYILTGVVTVLFSSVLFYNNPSLANGQIISGYFFYQLIAVIGLGIALIASCMSREKFTCALPDYGMLVITILGMISGLTDGYQPPARLALLSSGYWALRVIYNRTPGSPEDRFPGDLNGRDRRMLARIAATIRFCRLQPLHL